MKIIAHRGSNRKSQENSKAAFDIAIEEKADRIECDLQITKDQRIVIFHNEAIKINNSIVRIDQLNYLEAKEYIQLQCNYNLLTVEEVLEKYLPLIELNIEIKPSNPLLAQQLTPLIKQHQLREKIIVSSFQEQPLLYFRDHAPNIKRACLIDHSTLKQWPMTFSNYAPQVFMQKVATNIIHPYFQMIDDDFMDYACLKNWKVYTWATMADEQPDEAEEQWEELYLQKVDGHCTNLPGEFYQWAQEQKNKEASLLNRLKNIQQKTLRPDLNL